MLRYRKIDIDGPTDLVHLLKWYSDPKIRHFCFPHGDAASYRKKIEQEPIYQKFLRKLTGQYRFYMIAWNGQLIGEFSVELGGGHLQKHRPKSAWIGVVIGEENARGIGLGQRIMRKVEEVASEMGALRIELGVFEFNKAAIALYTKLGYREFARLPHKTYWRGRMWSSLCMEKRLDERTRSK